MDALCITSMKTLCKSQINSSNSKRYFCRNCLQFYCTTNKTHNIKECGQVASIYPEPNTKSSFKAFSKKLSPPVVIYADIEAVLENYQTASNNPEASFTLPKQKHTACAVSFYVVHKYNPELNKLWTYDGADCMTMFVQTLKDETMALYQKYWKDCKEPIHEFDIDDEDYQEHGNCYACEEPIEMADRDKYFDQFSVKYQGPIHKKCKISFKLSSAFFPVVFHNLSRYDIHLFINELGGELKPIRPTKELYIALSQKIFQKGIANYSIKYIDSNRFLNSSLEKLASNMEDNDFNILKSKFSGEKFQQMRRKGVFPYDYIDSFSKFNETELPPRDYFYNTLTDEECSVSNYNFAKEIWDSFHCRSLRDYMKLYLESDVLILADVFENFRNIWDAMMKYTKAELELISDPNMYNFLKRGIRGGLTQCTQRISHANNKYIKNYDEAKPKNYLSYIDANNLYGRAMSQKLPFSNFKFLSESEINMFDIINIDSSGDTGFILEVDLEYPDNIHDKHNSLPFCPENMVPPGGKIPKLLADLTDKEVYIIHLKQLQLCLQQGLKLKKVHRILSFSQSYWLKPYIDLNTKHRKLAKNDFEKNFYKLMNHAVYGKTMENVEKLRNIALVTHYESRRNSPGFRQRVAMHNFHSLEIFGENLAAIESTKTSIQIQK
ncbi:uncharacterized protein LOC123257706 [Drosophila ananassae]|uniref:uncharacterized protein LOC123257706 n=1 Tax=Drosophila ananassae TaxID=7217 RepID=UPI001CFFFBF4|nr:uncharacterized protein LOC123257706 [Drosophila ananassae]